MSHLKSETGLKFELTACRKVISAEAEPVRDPHRQLPALDDEPLLLALDVAQLWSGRRPQVAADVVKDRAARYKVQTKDYAFEALWRATENCQKKDYHIGLS